MSVTFPTFLVGDSLQYEGLTVFPLFAPPSSPVDPADCVEYDLSDEALRKGTLTVEEVSEAGSVPNLSVDNQGELHVLFLEGEELIGAKQNRVLNTSVLVPAHRKSHIPVSCVEAGRWGYKSRRFGSGGTHSSSKLRWVLKKSVSRSIKSTGSYSSDQGGVWNEVARQQASLGAVSGTSAMADTFAKYQQKLQEFGQEFQYVPGAVGLAVAINGQVAAIDVFDKPSTCAKVWDRLLTGVILDSLEEKQADKQAGTEDVQRVLNGLQQLNWEPAATVGDGTELRAESPGGDHASALWCHDVLVHGSVVCA